MVAGIALSLALVPGIGEAWHCEESGSPTSISYETSDRGWVAHRIEVAAPGNVSFGMFTRASGSTQSAMAFWVVAADGHEVEHSIFIEGEVKSVSAGIEAGTPSVSVSARRGDGTPLSRSHGLTLDAGVYTVVMAAAADGAAEISLDACGDFAILASASGDDVTLVDASGFSGTLNTSASGAGGLVRAAAVMGSSRSERVAGSLFGVFYSFDEGAVSYEGPATSERGKNLYAFTGAQAGPYRFDIEQAVGTPLGTTALFVADVALP